MGDKEISAAPAFWFEQRFEPGRKVKTKKSYILTVCTQHTLLFCEVSKAM